MVVLLLNIYLGGIVLSLNKYPEGRIDGSAIVKYISWWDSTIVK